MRNQEWDPALAQLHSLDLCQLVFRLFRSNPVNGETALCVVDKAKVLSGFLDCDDVHKTSRISGVGSDFSINPGGVFRILSSSGRVSLTLSGVA